MKKFLFVFLLASLFSTFCLASDSKLNMFLVRHIQITTPGGIIKANNYKLNTYTLIRETSFMGVRVKMNKLVIQSLKCVEKRIKKSCNDKYNVGHLSGWRDSDTILGVETSDHIYGVSLDIDPNINPCCGCTEKWRKSPRCAGEGVIEHDHGPKTGRYDLPQCWIDSFKKENWYWYGDDPSLRDTMHFTFIGKPNQTCQ